MNKNNIKILFWAEKVIVPREWKTELALKHCTMRW